MLTKNLLLDFLAELPSDPDMTSFCHFKVPYSLKRFKTYLKHLKKGTITESGLRD
jgi:hypothetical protein